MRRLFLSLVLCTCAPLVARAFFFRPSVADPAITNFNDFQFGYAPVAPARNTLVIFLPGTGGKPAGYNEFLEAARDAGFHSLGLCYPNGTGIGEACENDPASNCFFDIRMEIIDGTDRVTNIAVDRVNSIENRLYKSLAYLAVDRPSENWGQFIDGTNANWPRIIMAGHSQGGGHAAVMAKTHYLRRALVFANADWWTISNKPAAWLSAPSVTPQAGYFHFSHRLDPLATSSVVLAAWSVAGLTNIVPSVIADNLADPFDCSHLLFTDLDPPTNGFDGVEDYHNMPVLDATTPMTTNGEPVYLDIWKHMLAGASERVEHLITLNAGGPAMIYMTCTGLLYNVEASSNGTDYVTQGSPFQGTGASVTTDIANATLNLHRVSTITE